MAACWAPSSSSSWPWEGSLSDAAPGILMNFKHQQQQEPQQQNSGCDSMGLRLGKRTYFEDSAPAPPPRCPAPDHSSPVPVSRLVSTPAARKKQRGPAQPPATPSCQVEGCSADLSGSKGYHRRHRVCEIHSKTPKNIVAGIEQRFCQQCSRFHVLGEFDEGKRSCRRRLAGHNERRRKPPPSEAFALHHSGLLGGASPIFQAELLAHQQQHQQHQHLLDGTFIGKSSWPDSTALLRSAIHHHLDHQHHPPQQQQQQQQDSGQSVLSVIHSGNLPAAGFYLKSINRDSVASQGVYQFLKCNAVAAAAAASSNSCSSLPIEPGIVSSAGALSLLSAEPWSSSSSSPPPSGKMFVSQQVNASASTPDHPSKLDHPPLFHLQLQHDGYHHQHHHPQQQQQRDQNHQNPHHHQQLQKFGLNEFLQYQKPLEAVYDHV